ncbi:MAG: hypothetical protein E7625_00600 [Ruminococcaceae bacterium]|nr:hypothetical protein [Oscillospiraceae bacterium]
MNKTKAWEQYEAGQAYKRRIGLYETVGRNQRFYCGDQWGDSRTERALPKPVFNVVRRVTDYLIGAVAGGKVSVGYEDNSSMVLADDVLAARMREGIAMLNHHVAYRWENCHMDRLIYRLLLDAALSGDGVLYCYWDSALPGADAFGGDIRTVRWSNCELYAADMNRADIQSQEYIILAGRESVAKLRREAKEAGLDEEQIARIRSDATSLMAASRPIPELEDEEQAKATVLLKFFKQDGVVWFEKSTREVVLRRVETGMHLYPVAYFNWMPTYGSFHGTAPASGMVANQKFINRAYAMMMKHMTDTAFSKVIYDKSRIPEWTNEVGEAIAAVGGNLADAVQVVGTGHMQDGYMALIESAISVTKELAGATDTALGSAQASNTSAILALQEASRTALLQVNTAYQQCLEDVADIWADMLCASCNGERLLPMLADGERRLSRIDFEALRQGILHAHVEIGNLTQYSASGTQNTLEKLLDGGHITLEQYLEQLPAGILPMRGLLLSQWKEQRAKEESDDGRGADQSGAARDA